MHSAILDWASRENVDLLVLGTRENKNTMQKIVPGTNNIGSTSDIIKSRCKCPCLIVRPAVGSLRFAYHMFARWCVPRVLLITCSPGGGFLVFCLSRVRPPVGSSFFDCRMLCFSLQTLGNLKLESITNHSSYLDVPRVHLMTDIEQHDFAQCPGPKSHGDNDF